MNFTLKEFNTMPGLPCTYCIKNQCNSTNNTDFAHNGEIFYQTQKCEYYPNCEVNKCVYMHGNEHKFILVSNTGMTLMPDLGRLYGDLKKAQSNVPELVMVRFDGVLNNKNMEMILTEFKNYNNQATFLLKIKTSDPENVKTLFEGFNPHVNSNIIILSGSQNMTNLMQMMKCVKSIKMLNMKCDILMSQIKFDALNKKYNNMFTITT